MELIDQIEELALERGRFSAQAYLWIFRVLEYTRLHLRREGHISGKELLEGHRRLGLESFGPMALDVFTHWGVHSTSDIGRVVFDLVESGLLGSTEEDTIADFDGVYDFHDAFVKGHSW